MRRSFDDRLKHLLRSRDPRMRRANKHSWLMRRVRILLDGQDVTRLCCGFSLPRQEVETFVEDGGKRSLTWTCRCGVFRGRRAGRFTMTGRCLVCGETAAVEVARGKKKGLVEIECASGQVGKQEAGEA